MRILILILINLLFLANAYAEDFSITSSAFKNNDRIPILYACDGKNLSPPLSWANEPSKTAAFALTMSSPDWSNEAVYLWLLYNLPKNVHSLAEGASTQLPKGTQTGMNFFNEPSYRGPCPPDSLTHRYIFTIHALDSKLDISPEAGVETIVAQINKHTLKQAQIEVTFSH